MAVSRPMAPRRLDNPRPAPNKMKAHSLSEFEKKRQALADQL
jgi:hypothetical protein